MTTGDKVRDRLWVWAHPEGSYNGPQWGLPSDSRVTPLESAVWLGVPNIIFIHYAELPREPLAQYARPLEAAGALMWSIVGGGGETSAAMRDSVLKVAAGMPNLTGLFMDDFFHFRGRPPTQWLAAPSAEFPVTVEIRLARKEIATRLELVQSDWVAGQHRSADVLVELASSSGKFERGTLITVPNDPGGSVEIEVPSVEISSVRLRILGSHDTSGPMSCGLSGVRLHNGGRPIDLEGADVRVSSRYPAAGRSIEERMAVTDGREGDDWADPALMSPEVLISRAPPVAASLTPAELAEVRSDLHALDRPLDLGVAIYDYQLGVPSISRHLELVDLVVLWHWHPQDLPNLIPNVERLKEFAPGKRMMIGLYMWDFADGREIPLELHQQACDRGLELLRSGAIEGMVFLAGNLCDIGIPAVEWTRDWISDNGSLAVGAS
jgi:hypothetical protein